MPKHLPSRGLASAKIPAENLPEEVQEEVSLELEEKEFERDYSKMDLVDLIDQPAWKTILLGLVETEKMDPWNIDVALLAEKYLKKINELEGGNLRVPANAILACAILLKTKSKYLRLSSLDDKEKESMTPEQRNLFLEELPDLMANRSAREGRITLDELVSSIEDIIHRTTPKKSLARDIPRMEITFDTSTIEERMQVVLDLIKERIDSQGIVLFKALVDGEGSEIIVETFLPILFLMNKGTIIAYQNEFFGEIFVKLIEGFEAPQESLKQGS